MVQSQSTYAVKKKRGKRESMQNYTNIVVLQKVYEEFGFEIPIH